MSGGGPKLRCSHTSGTLTASHSLWVVPWHGPGTGGRYPAHICAWTPLFLENANADRT